jgi:vancomycin resistance protein YoaR
VSAIEGAARAGAGEVELEGAPTPPFVTVEDLGVEDISSVLASFETRFAIGEKSRNDNPKMAAARLDGHVLKPGEVFSFNEVVGGRSEKEGYKVAGVIERGEMVDGMAGGACQISTTLHAAAFFAGIDIVESTPHSRPSTYVQMGLDATVVYPRVDLKLRNSYDFPVVIHYTVARGVSRVEFLGKERPYDKIVFERTVKKRLPFETITREDRGIAIGHMIVDQPGYPGYQVLRERQFYKDGKRVKTNRWNLQYRPVVEYVRMGASPNPNLAPPTQKKTKGPKPASGTYRLAL